MWHQSDGTKDVLPFHPDADDLGMQFIAGLNHDWAGGHKAWNNGKYDQWIPAKSRRDDGVPDPRGHPVPLRARRRVHGLRRLPLLVHRRHRPEPLLHVDRVTRATTARAAARSSATTRRGYDWTTYPERLEQAGVSWKIYQDIGDGLDAAGSWGWIEDAYRGNYGDNSLLYFNKYRNAQPGDPLYDKARTGTDVKHGERLLRRSSRPT